MVLSRHMLDFCYRADLQTLHFSLSPSAFTDLPHAALRPSLHPLDGALAVEGRVALTVDGEVGVGAVHDQNHVQVLLDP